MAALTVSKTNIDKMLVQDEQPMAVEVVDGVELNVYGFRTHDGEKVPGVTRVVAAHPKFDYVIGEA
jgi:hypothetical protein